MTLTEQIKDTIELLKSTDINGCITGSSMLDADFDTWASHPDIDLFVYTEPQLQYAECMLEFKYGFKPITKGEDWKVERVHNKGMQKNAFLSTVKVGKGDVVVNITYKKGKNNLMNVLSSFDMSIIMIGYDIRKHVLLDLRCGWDNMVHQDPENRWSHDINVAVPNPLRDQDVDMYGVQMWVRQFNRVIKYWTRGFDTRPMAEFYIKLINRVINDGQLFDTEKSKVNYEEFKTLYEPVRDKMVEWLKDKEEC